ncbi:hypothetical protein BC941DRAFT_424151 [Chlamydoabsidia padenii]|nr:hypothetical protein BC941DRAFT_424151 [Chlamydoabsidia padenii]
MSDLPLEIIDHIFTFVDASSLYELGHVSRVLRLLSQKHLYQQHLQHVSIRLWMHQPGTMAHTPIDFNQPTRSDDLTAADFTFQNQPLRFDPKKPILIDGCTVILSDKTHYGLTYEPMTVQPDRTSKQGQWSLLAEQDGDHLKPLGLSCHLNLFNPLLLDSLMKQQTRQLRERIQLRKNKMTSPLAGFNKSMFGAPLSIPS